MKKTIAMAAFLGLAGQAFATGLDIDKYVLNPDDIRSYTPAESCAKAKEALKVLTHILRDKAEELHACLADQLNEAEPTPTRCPLRTWTSLPRLQDYETLRWIDCNPKRDPAFPTRTSAYRFLE